MCPIDFANDLGLSKTWLYAAEFFMRKISDKSHRQVPETTHAEQILQALRILTGNERGAIFTRQQVRDCLNISPERWSAGYTAIFQAMRSDHPGGAPQIANRYEGIIERINRGEYRLTAKGKKLLFPLAVR